MPRLVLIVFALAVCLAAQPAWAQTRGKPKRCLSAAEVTTEQVVRHGVFLRESGWRCEEFTPGSKKLWTDFDTANAARLSGQTDKRKRVYQREFKADWVKVMTYFDGRLVTYHRHVPITHAYCANVTKMLKEIERRGWGAFAKQAKVVQNEVYLDYKVCSP